MNLGHEGFLLEQLRVWAEDRLQRYRARAEHRRSGDPGLWVCNKEQWSDRRVMTSNTRVRWLRRVSRSSIIKEAAIL